MARMTGIEFVGYRGKGGIVDDWKDSRDTLAEFVGYRGRLEGSTRILWLNLSGIGDD